MLAASRSFVLATGVLTVVLACVILLGWMLNLTLLKSGIPSQRATQPLTAVCLLISGFVLTFSCMPRKLPLALMRAGLLTVLLFVALTFWQNALDTDWGLDQFLFTDAVLHEQTGQYLRAGRPAAGTLLALALWSASLLLVRTQHPVGKTLYVWFTTLGSLFALTIVLAYAFGLRSLYALGLYAQVGFNSGLCLSVLFAGALMRRPDLGWMSLLTTDSVGAVSTRRLLMWTVSVLVVLTGIVQIGTSKALYGAEFEVTLITLCGIALLFVSLLSHARRLNELEALRRRVAEELRVAEAEIAGAAQRKEQFLAALAHELRNPLAPLRNGLEIIRQSAGPDRMLIRTADMMSRQMDQLVSRLDELLRNGEPITVTEKIGQGAAATEGLTPGAAQSQAGRLLRVLIADDNADAAASLTLLLQNAGHEARTATDGPGAVMLAESFDPDVIFMDLGMPGFDGAEATRRIRMHPWGQRMRIVALTGWGHDSARRRAQAAGVDLHLVKPVDPQALATILLSGRPP